MTRRRLLPATAVAALVPLLLSGCAFNANATARELEEAVMSASPGVDDVLVSFSTSGFNRVPTAKLYISNVAETDLDDLVRVTDSALRVIWTSMPYEPADVAIAFADSPKPDDAEIGYSDIVRIDAVWQELQLEGGGTDIYVVSRAALADRYGERSD